MHKRRTLATLSALACAGALPSVRAQAPFPARPVRLVVPFAPGGSSEIIARAVAQRLSQTLGQNVYVENKPGGAGNIAMEEVKRAAPDGHTLVLGHIGTLAVNPAMFGAKLPYDPQRDFAPVALLASVPNVIAANPALPARTLSELVALAKAKPGELNYGSAGNGSAGHLAMEYFKLKAGVQITHVPYRGTGPMLADLLAGQTQLTFNGVSPLMAQLKSGKLRALAVGTAQRLASLPQVPTIAESGYPGFETSQWYGLLAPAGTPAAVIARLNAEVAAALKTPEASRRITEDGGAVAGGSPEQFARLIREEIQRWGAVVKAAHITTES